MINAVDLKGLFKSLCTNRAGGKGAGGKHPECAGNPGLQCNRRYPNPQAFFMSIQKVLKPKGRLIFRDYTGGAVLRWLMNHVEMPLAHLAGHGDVGVYSEKQIRAFCEKAGLELERFERRKGMRMHCIIRKPQQERGRDGA